MRSHVFEDVRFWFCSIFCLHLSNFFQICPSFDGAKAVQTIQILLKFVQILTNFRPNFAPKIFQGDTGASPAPTPLRIGINH